MRGKTTVGALKTTKIDDGFNEAPAKCGGKPHRHPCGSFGSPSFNEAPAKCGGKPVLPAPRGAATDTLQ